MYLMVALPDMVWKVIDVLCIVSIYTILSQFTEYKISLACLICVYPFMHMASAGWIATTTNYLWPFAAMVIDFYLLYSWSLGNHKRIVYYILYYVLLIYATNSELIAVLYLLSLVLFGLMNNKTNKISVYVSSSVICILGIINVLICPGNALRTAKEITRWMPEYPDLSLIDKIRICIVLVVEHFTSVPNVIFMLLSFLVLYYGIRSFNQMYKKIIAVFPFVISVLITAYYFVNKIVVNHD